MLRGEARPMKRTIYMKVTKDRYSLPEAVATSVKELARICGVSENAISSSIGHAKRGDWKSPYVKVVVEDDEE